MPDPPEGAAWIIAIRARVLSLNLFRDDPVEGLLWTNGVGDGDGQGVRLRVV